MATRPGTHGGDGSSRPRGDGDEGSTAEGGGRPRASGSRPASNTRVALDNAKITVVHGRGRGRLPVKTRDPNKTYVDGPDHTKEPVTIELRMDEGYNRAEFIRKARALQDLGEEGALYKATNPGARDPNLTLDHKYDLLNRIETVYAHVPEFRNRLLSRVYGSQADHVHELQLGGKDVRENLRMLHAETNRGVGEQIRLAIVRDKIADGTPIRIRIVDE
ncbi:hypothetical protein ACIA8K_29060 [Catenuloplanes sp. NPDC051500]|uniref:hypothetical protein n=1 Tax=Catenuloplanes sp. NPDC051500 TaxID=3363959 RepID=UPI0037B5454D